MPNYLQNTLLATSALLCKAIPAAASRETEYPNEESNRNVITSLIILLAAGTAYTIGALFSKSQQPEQATNLNSEMKQEKFNNQHVLFQSKGSLHRPESRKVQQKRIAKESAMIEAFEAEQNFEKKPTRSRFEKRSQIENQRIHQKELAFAKLMKAQELVERTANPEEEYARVAKKQKALEEWVAKEQYKADIKYGRIFPNSTKKQDSDTTKDEIFSTKFSR